MNDVLLLVGRGRYEDPWHDHPAVSQVLLEVLADLPGPAVDDVSVRSTFPDALDDVSVGTLLVVLAGRGRTDPSFDGDDTAWSAFHDLLAALVAGGSPLLGLHAAANAFADSRHWADLLGGRWVPGTSMHPPRGPAAFDVVPGHPVVDGLVREGVGVLRTDDERYCLLEVHPASQVLLTTHEDGVDHPVAWVAAPRPGHGRVVYDGLGHDARAAREPDRLALLRQELAWLLGR